MTAVWHNSKESSGWLGVTAADNDDPLMFTYKQNNCWTKDFLEFLGTDPLFRKGEYDKLTYGMLYNYGEDFMLSLNHDDFREKAFVDMVSGSDEKAHLSDIKAALGFMYAHPGSKMFADRRILDLEKFMSELNKFYENAALYEFDNDPDGFMWLENSNPEETVIAMQRADSKGNKFCDCQNFTPVRRENYRLHVDAEYIKHLTVSGRSSGETRRLMDRLSNQIMMVMIWNISILHFLTFIRYI